MTFNIPDCLGFMVKESEKCKSCFLCGDEGDCFEITEERKYLEKMRGKQVMERPISGRDRY